MERLERVRQLISDGWLTTDIAEELRVNGRTILRDADSLGLADKLKMNRKNKALAANDARVLAHFSSLENVSIQEIASKAGISILIAVEAVSRLIDSGALSWSLPCEKCETVMTKIQGAGRFCSKFCARQMASNSITVSGALKRDEALRDPSNREKSLSAIRELSAAGGLTWSSERRQLRRESQKLYMALPESRKKLSDWHKEHPRKWTDESRAKLSVSAREATLKTMAEGRHHPWKSRPKGTASYPERFWMSIFEVAQIPYEFNKPLARERNFSFYFLDFVFMNHAGESLVLEIDGKQHGYPERAQSDLVRDAYVRSLGIDVVRKGWTSNPEALHQQVLETQELLSIFFGKQVKLTE